MVHTGLENVNHCVTMATVPKRIIIVCAGGQGAIVADILQRAHDAGADALAIGFVDDTPELAGTAVLGLEVLGSIASLSGIDHDAIVVALGDNEARRAITERLLAAGERLAAAIHPRACIAPSSGALIAWVRGALMRSGPTIATV